LFQTLAVHFWIEASFPLESDMANQLKVALLPLLSTAALIKLKNKNYPWLSPSLTSRVSQDGVFEGLPPDAQFFRSEAR